MDAIVKALAHPVRLRVVRQLILSGPATQEELRREIGIPPGAMSKHISELSSVRLIARPSPRGRLAVVHDDRTAAVLRSLAELAAAIDAAVAAESAAEAELWARGTR